MSTQPIIPASATGPVLDARPEAIRLDPKETALIVVDMQNAYATPGGYVDLAGFDLSGARSTIANIQRAIAAAHAAGIQVVFFQNGWDKQYVEAGGVRSPNIYKSNALKVMRKRPELMGTLLAKETWDYAIIDELKPAEGDWLVPKPRYSGFFNTPLDSMLRSRGIHNLIFTGIATNVCVESTLRDGFFLEYFGVILGDACYQLGSGAIQEGTLYNIENFFGWVSDTARFEEAFGASA